MKGGADNQGSRPGNTFSERQARARTGAFAGKSYPQDSGHVRESGSIKGKDAGQGTAIVKKRPLETPKTGNSPWERPQPTKRGHGL